MTDTGNLPPDDVMKTSARVVQLIEMVFPGDTNHHGTLFGGVALAHMDKVAFLAASRHGRASFVTAASEKINFAAPARAGDMVEVTGQVVRVGTSSLDVEVELVAEEPVTGNRRLCTRGRFTLVAQKGSAPLPPLPPIDATACVDRDALHLLEMVFPGQTNHYGTLYGRRAQDDGEGRVHRGHAARAGHHGHGSVRSDRLHLADPRRRDGGADRCSSDDRTKFG